MDNDGSFLAGAAGAIVLLVVEVSQHDDMFAWLHSCIFMWRQQSCSAALIPMGNAQRSVGASRETTAITATTIVVRQTLG
jgi:hypothetical protein